MKNSVLRDNIRGKNLDSFTIELRNVMKTMLIKKYIYNS